MKKLFLVSICILVSTSAALAGSPRVTTLASRPGPLGTNATLIIPAGQAAKVLFARFSTEGDDVKIAKGGVLFGIRSSSGFTVHDAVVEGPATIQVTVSGVSVGAVATIERWRMPQNFPSPVTGFQSSGKVQTLISYSTTNATLQIPAGQAAKVISFLSSPADSGGGVVIYKDGVGVDAVNSAGEVSGIVEGPATILVASGTASSMATVERWRVPRVIPLLMTK